MNISELGLVTQSGKVVWGKYVRVSARGYTGCHGVILFLFLSLGKYAQVTNNPENDGCINAVLLV